MLPKQLRRRRKRHAEGATGHAPARAKLGEESLEQLRNAVRMFFSQLAASKTDLAGVLRAVTGAARTARPSGPSSSSLREQGILDLAVALAGNLGINPSYAKILRGAAEVFGSASVDEAGIDDILAAAQVSRRTFYQFFRNKTEVSQALFELVVTIWVELFKDSLRHDTKAEERLARALAIFIEAFSVVGTLLRAMIAETLRPGSTLFARYESVRGEIIATLTPLLSEIQGHQVEEPWVRSRIAGILAIPLDLQLGSESSSADVVLAKKMAFGLFGLGKKG